MIETLILPGLGGSGAGHWQREWASRDAAALVVEQEDWHRPVLAEWLHELEAQLIAAPGAVLVAHSLGCALVAALAGRPAASHVAGALLVAPADVAPLARSHADVRGFPEGPGERLPFPSILVASRNDPFMSFRRAEDHARAWGSALVDIGEAGHVNIDSGFGHWPDAVTLATGLRGREAAPGGLSAHREAARRWWTAVPGAPGPVHDAGFG
ncbi:RBBP9/YdeN family alpha/beta hydrolase [Aureimonas populi]|uniref:RBBP9/YdeN family alpha/beta hydrolase n=1 Tax=Aureimonas populi TaxID=1701758 RepID=A0ABW5CRJ2_9HYPH|nr:alpha/beta hydrolase [Aureimonas populi]